MTVSKTTPKQTDGYAFRARRTDDGLWDVRAWREDSDWFLYFVDDHETLAEGLQGMEQAILRADA